MKVILFIISAVCILNACVSTPEASDQPVYVDKAYTQEISIKYYFEDEAIDLYQAYSDRNGAVKIMSSSGLFIPDAGQFLYPGTLAVDVSYRPMTDKNIRAMGIYDEQFVFLDDKAVLSNAWAGKLYAKHNLADARLFAMGKDFSSVVSDGHTIQGLSKDGLEWEASVAEDEIIDMLYDNKRDLYWLLGTGTLYTCAPADGKIEQIDEGAYFTCFSLADNDQKLLIGTSDGYFEVDPDAKTRKGDVVKKMPWTELTTINEIDGNLWFGSSKGAFMQKDDGGFDYYASQRWLPGDSVLHISGAKNAVLILTNKGLAKIVFKSMTLADKAAYFDAQVRERHIRNGFNATITRMNNGDLSTGVLSDSDNDGLWTTMYQAGEVFRYAVTGSEDALQNVRESLEAMERLYTINPVPGFPSRSFERHGYKDHDKPWRQADDPEWDWKSTTSSDEVIGHIFVFGAIAELIDDQEMKDKAIELIDTLMTHVVENDFYLIDWDGKHTLWGRWNPEYVNGFPTNVGDRKLNSSNIIGMLQTAYHFTGKEIFKEKAFMLMEEYGYLENLMRPIAEIGSAPDGAGDWAKMLSSTWNHSDDEMYYVGYWGLYRYAFNDTLKAMYKEAIIDHWQAERPEKEGLWNIFTAITGTDAFDLEEAVWYLKEYPLDLIDWSVMNSHRKDIELVEPNFRRQTTTEVLPPDELRISRHNANRFGLDHAGRGGSEFSAGDIWLLPYWMGRYLGVISAPVRQ